MRDLNSAEVLYIQLLQENISRMNQNCMQCKTWCIAIVTGILAVVATTQKIELIFAGMIVTLGAYLLDASYLRLEKNFRCFEKRLVDLIKTSEETNDDYLFDFDKDKLTTKRTRFLTRKEYGNAPDVPANSLHWRDSIFSWSTMLVYGAIEVLLLFVYLILHTPVAPCCCCCA